MHKEFGLTPPAVAPLPGVPVATGLAARRRERATWQPSLLPSSPLINSRECKLLSRTRASTLRVPARPVGTLHVTVGTHLRLLQTAQPSAPKLVMLTRSRSALRTLPARTRFKCLSLWHRR